jgi:hypothetical protein
MRCMMEDVLSDVRRLQQLADHFVLSLNVGDLRDNIRLMSISSFDREITDPKPRSTLFPRSMLRRLTLELGSLTEL